MARSARELSNAQLPFHASPFLKWAGGKAQLLPAYNPYFPRVKLEGYIEPFVGGGAVFFYFLREFSYLLPEEPGRLVLADDNAQLINCYRIIQGELSPLIRLLARRDAEYNANGNFKRRQRLFRAAREENPASPVERAARFIFLNRTCYNGLYRVNSRGEFNVPMGRYRCPRILDEPNLSAVRQSLKEVDLFHADFEEITRKFAAPGWFIYFDPPYMPLSQTSSFTGYTKNGFTLEDQERLCRLFTDLDEMGCYVMLSNSGHGAIRKFYERYEPVAIPARRAINSKPNRRGEIVEYLVIGHALRRALRAGERQSP